MGIERDIWCGLDVFRKMISFCCAGDAGDAGDSDDVADCCAIGGADFSDVDDPGVDFPDWFRHLT